MQYRLILPAFLIFLASSFPVAGGQRYVYVSWPEGATSLAHAPAKTAFYVFDDSGNTSPTQTLAYDDIAGLFGEADQHPTTRTWVMAYQRFHIKEPGSRLLTPTNFYATASFSYVNIDHPTTRTDVTVPYPESQSQTFRCYFIERTPGDPEVLIDPLGGKDDTRLPYVYSLRTRTGVFLPPDNIPWEKVLLTGTSGQRQYSARVFPYDASPGSNLPVLRELSKRNAKISSFDQAHRNLVSGFDIRQWIVFCQDNDHLLLAAIPRNRIEGRRRFFLCDRETGQWRHLFSETGGSQARLFSEWCVIQEMKAGQEHMAAKNTGDFTFWSLSDDQTRVSWKATVETEVLNMWGNEFCYRDAKGLHLAEIKDRKVVYKRFLVKPIAPFVELRRPLEPGEDILNIHWIYRIPDSTSS